MNMNPDPRPKKILILYTAHTLGHQRIAENIAHWLSLDGAEVVLREVLKSHPSPIVQKYLKAHIWVNEHAPWFWRFMYLYGFWVAMMPLRLLVARFASKEITRVIVSENPDVVVTTQTSPSAVVSVLKQQKVYQGLWGIAFSDYHFHRGWVYPRSDFYLINIEEQKEYLARLGVDAKSVYLIGMALPPPLPVRSELFRDRFAIPRNARVLLVASGTLGVRFPVRLRELLVACRHEMEEMGMDLRVVVACGKNASTYQEYQKAATELTWMLPLSFYEPMSEVYAASDAILTKPGGITIAESLAVGLPVFISHYLPGQEELNVQYLIKKGVARVLYSLEFHKQVEMLVQGLSVGRSLGPFHDNGMIEQLVRPKSLEQLGAFIEMQFHKR